MAPQCEVDDSALAQLRSYGLPDSLCRDALLRFDNDVEEALDFLLEPDEEVAAGGAEDPAAQAAGPTRSSTLSNGAPAGPPLFQRLLSAVQSLDVKQLQEALAGVDEELLADALAWKTPGDGASLMHHLLAEKPGDLDCIPLKRDMARELLEARCDVNCVNLMREAPIVVAARACSEGPADLDVGEGSGLEDQVRLALVHELLQARADPNLGDIEGETALMEACCFGDAALCRALLQARANPEDRCTEGSCSLDFAEDQPEVLSLLRAALVEPSPIAAATEKLGADVTAGGPLDEEDTDTISQNTVDELAEEVSALSVEEMVTRLCTALTVPNAMDRAGPGFQLMLDQHLKEIDAAAGDETNARQLGELFQARNADVVLLLELVQASTPSTTTARAVSWLLAAKTDPNATDEAREAALTLSVRTGTRCEAGLTITKALLESAANPNVSDDEGETPLMEAACLGDFTRCRVLLAANADVMRRNSSGLLPVEFAEDQPDILELFASHMQAPERASEEDQYDAEQTGLPQPDDEVQPEDEAETLRCQPAGKVITSGETPDTKASSTSQGQDMAEEEEEANVITSDPLGSYPDSVLQEGTASSSQEDLGQAPMNSNDTGSASSSKSKARSRPPEAPGASAGSDTDPWILLPKSPPDSDDAWAVEGPDAPDSQQAVPMDGQTTVPETVPDSVAATQEETPDDIQLEQEEAGQPAEVDIGQEEPEPACEAEPEQLSVDEEDEDDDAAPSDVSGLTPRPDDARGPRASGPGNSGATLVSEFLASVRRYDTTSMTGLLAKMETSGINVAQVLGLCDPDGNGLVHECVKIFHSGQDFAAAGSATVQLLIDLQCDPRKKNKLGETPLMMTMHSAAAVPPESSVFEGAAAIMRVLIEAKSDPNEGDEHGETPLMEAACIPSTLLCRVLLDSKADVLQKSRSDLTAFDFAEDKPEVAELLSAACQDMETGEAEAGVDVQAQDTWEASAPEPPLPQSRHTAEKAGETPPRTPASQTRSAASPLHCSTAEEARAAERVRKRPSTPLEQPGPEQTANVKMTELLEKARRCPNASPASPPEKKLLGLLDRRTVIPLVDAVQAHSVKSVKERIAGLQKANRKTGISVAEIMGGRDADGHTLLHLAILAPLLRATIEDAAGVVETLIEVRAEVNAANGLSETPLLLAVRELPKEGNSRLHLVERLLHHQADANLADSGRVTPLHEAANAKDRKLLELLLQHGGSAFLRGGRKKCSAFEELWRNAPSLAAYLSESLATIQTRPVDTGQGQGQGEAARREAEQAEQAAKKAQVLKEQLIADMCHEVQGHSVAGIREVVRVWEEERWPVERLLLWQDHDGNGWLHLCLLAPPLDADWGQVREVVSELLALSADADLSNSAGETPLWLVAREGSSSGPTSGGGGGGGGSSAASACVDLVHDLLGLGAQVDGATQRGRTPLMEAAEAGDLFLCQALLKAGADPDLAPPALTSAARIASANPELVALFSDYSRDPLWKEGGAAGAIGGASATATATATTTASTGSAGVGQSPMVLLKQQVMLHDHERLEALLAAERVSLAEVMNQQDRDGNSLLHLCLLAPPSSPDLRDQLQTLQLLLAARADPCSTSSSGETPLHLAVRETPPPFPGAGQLGGEAHPRLELVQVLLKASANPATSDAAGLTPLTEACQQDDTSLVEVFRKAGGDLNATSHKGKKAIDFAPAHGSVMHHFAAVAAEEAAAAAAASRKFASRAPALIQAVQAHDAKQLSELLAGYKADGKRVGPILSLQDADGHGLLHLCIMAPPVHADRAAMLETIKVLVHAKADANAPNFLGETPLLLSVRELAGSAAESRLSIVRALMKASAEADIGDAQDTTPLMEAAMLGDADLCRLLLDRGADMRRCGAGGLSALELASKFQQLRQVFDEQGETVPEEEDSDEEAEPVQVMLRHAMTGMERAITVAGNATICDLKKVLVRLSHRGSWRRVALLTEQGRLLHDSEYLNGRSLLIMADAKSAEARQAAEEALPEEERWKRWSTEELKAEADRRGVFGGSTKDQVLAALLEVKRWEGLAAADLQTECSKRGLLVDASADKDDFLAQLRQDFNWDYMESEDLKEECKNRGIALPAEPDAASLSRSMRSRLRQAVRWEMDSEEQLRKACELRNFEAAGMSKGDMLAWLKSFKTVARPKPKPQPKPKPEPQRRSASQGARASSSTGSRSREQSRQRPQEEEEEEESFGPQLPPGLSDRVKKVVAKYPGFAGAFPPDIDEWTDKEIDAYFYSNGNLLPNRKKKAKVSTIPKRVHYKTLGLADGAPYAEVRKAYRMLALKYHPDKNLGDPKAADNFKAIQDAYEALQETGN